MSIIISEYQDGTRNARVYKTNSGDYGILMFDALDQSEDIAFNPFLEDAEAYAENWVMRS